MITLKSTITIESHFHEFSFVVKIQVTPSLEEDGWFLARSSSLENQQLRYQLLLLVHYIKSAFGMCLLLLITCGMLHTTVLGQLLEVCERGAVFFQESKAKWKSDSWRNVKVMRVSNRKRCRRYCQLRVNKIRRTHGPWGKGYTTTLSDWSKGKQLILFRDNLNVSRGSASGNIEMRV